MTLSPLPQARRKRRFSVEADDADAENEPQGDDADE
jgi:hypothetical protein